MSLRINHNIASINGHRNLLNNNMAVQSSLEKLSSGLRINKAADDAAGLVISEQMRAQITGLNQAIDNSETAVSMVQTAEGALDEINSLLNKARELTLHAANEGANDTNQLEADQKELDNVISSIDRISSFTQFGTKKLLDGSLNGVASKDSAFSRVNVGNLANNSAVNNGAFSVDIAETDKGYTVATTGTATTASGMFGTGTASFAALTTGTTIHSGAVLTINIDGTDFTATSGTTVGALVSQINSSTGLGNYSVSVGSGGGIRVDRTDVTDELVDVSVSFSFTGVADSVSAGQNGTMVANFDDNDLQMAALFGSNDSSLITGSTTMTGAGQVRITFTDSNGTFHQADVAYADGDSLTDVLSGVRANLTTNVSGVGTGTTFSITSSATGFSVTFDTNRETYSGATGTALASQTLSLRFDNNNVVDGENDLERFSLSGITSGQASGLFGVTTGATILAASTLQAAATFTFTIDGEEHALSFAAGTTMTDIASGLETALGTGYEVAFLSGGVNLTGVADFTAGQGITGQAGNTSTVGFYVANTDGIDVGGVSLAIDSAALTGNDVDIAVASVQAGAIPDAILNLDTASTSGQSGAISSTISGLAAGTLTASGFTQVAGDESIAATITSTANTGLSLTLTINADNSDSSLYTLELDADATGNDGFEDISFEMDAATIDAALVSGASFAFSVNNGAEFQVGANANQKVGLTIQSVDSEDLGRNVADSGTLTSLGDLISTEKGALTSGLTDEALNVIDAAIDEVTVLRGNLGAFQANTLESGLNSLRVSQENLTAAESTIRDVDFAAESANFTRNNILVQSATAMLAQANQLPQNVLQLLG